MSAKPAPAQITVEAWPAQVKSLMRERLRPGIKGKISQVWYLDIAGPFCLMRERGHGHGWFSGQSANMLRIANRVSELLCLPCTQRHLVDPEAVNMDMDGGWSLMVTVTESERDRLIAEEYKRLTKRKG
jgi:hypothetical protein